MRTFNALLIAAIGATSLTAGVPAEARRHHYNDRHYASSSRYDCQDRRSRGKRRGTLIGAGVGGLGVAALGGGVGESLLGAGVGAVAGHEIGKGRRCR